eukprot:CAMPEP_0202702226 /NCGR_PEP_ID=MMETSP1385-20130828/15253_1 /ASSEMBLY_ACC=CAM_ASM_000861 /TAXON_ID=933848 /ORGANISM="Elphidium margaritaceum" /LENGTH=215 /DNA_ID=CAMNT_0049359841 /DNA_START=153 /DNA_END=800 /DNA_ORIENTATION=-
MEKVCSCKCGVESPDVHYSKSRLIFTFITINLMAAALGLNELATSNRRMVILGRTNLMRTQTVNNLSFENITIETAELNEDYPFTDSGVCQRIDQSGLLSEDECGDVRVSMVSWLGLGVTSILILFVVFILLLRIECRKLCSKAMRQACIALLTLSLLFMTVAWILLIASPIPSNFNSLGSSFWITLLASTTNLAVLIISFVEYNKVGGGAASAA